MTPERLIKICKMVVDRYDGNFADYITKKRIFRDLRAVLRGLGRTENFLTNVTIKDKDIILGNDDDIPYISFLPYLYEELCEDGDTYFVYLENDMVEKSFICAIEYENGFTSISGNISIGIGIKLKNHFLGAYYCDDNIFRNNKGDIV